jgi:hypothetical protein
MYESCINGTNGMILSICDNITIEDEEEPIFDEELQRFVSLTVFILFGLIGMIGLVGNALVVLGEKTIQFFLFLCQRHS